ncbi:MAG: insulinase family protein [Proteobacteria bacterium]|nr:insulinase family protein [Pseudomonadota bacterium]MBU4471600.1 insulinase family protein [Pseudomonadota bacterium]MCG2751082.1 insulinase family protein [Desulfobacteraceae bacterium]
MHSFKKSQIETKKLQTKVFSRTPLIAGVRQVLGSLLFLFILLFLSRPAVCSTEKVPESLVLWPHEQSDLAPDPQVLFGRLENGFRYVLLENRVPEHRVSAHLSIQAGSVYEEDHQQGMAHFLEHMAFSGSTHFAPGELVKYFQNIGMQFGHDANARTGFYDTVYDLLLPGGEATQLEEGLLILKDYAEGALLLPEQIERERKVVLAEMMTRDSASYRTFVSAIQFELPGMRITERMPIGKEEVLRSMDRSAIKTFYDAWYCPGNMILILVGDFHSKDAVQTIEKYFAGMVPRAKPGVILEPGSFSHKGIKAFHHYEKEEGSTTVSLEVARSWKPAPDSFAFNRDQMVQNLANRIIQYRLDEQVRKADAPFSEVSISSGIYHQVASYGEISADCHPEDWDKALSALEQVLRQALEFGFTPKELERAKKERLSEFDNDVKNISGRDSQHLARKINGSITGNRVFQSPVQRKDLFAQVVSLLTARDLEASLKKTWAPDHRLILVTGNALPGETKDRAEEKIQNAYAKSAAVTVIPPEDSKAVVFPYLPEPSEKGLIARKSHDPASGILQIDFENKVRLNMKNTEFKPNEALISLSFGRGRFSEPVDRSGLSALSAEVINESGLGSLSFEDLKKALAGKKTEVSFRVAEDCFVFDVLTVPDEIDLAFELLRTHVLDQAFEEGAYGLAVKRQHQQYGMLDHSVEGATELYGRRFFAGGDTRFGLPSKEEFDRLTLSHVKDWISPDLIRSPLEVSVAGNFDTEAVIQAASKRLGTLPERQGFAPGVERPDPVFASGKTRKVSVDTQISKAMVVINYPTADLWDIKKTRRLSILAEILSEKIRQEIREKLGVAYSPNVMSRPSRVFKNYGTLRVTIETDPANVDQVLEEVRKIAKDLAEKGVSPEDLKRALDPMATLLKDMKRENGYWLRTVLMGSQRHPEQIAWSGDILEDYAAITPEEIWLLAKQFLDNGKAGIFIAQPKVR